MTAARIIYNAVRCDTCGTLLESWYRHDFRWCKCPSGSGTEIAVDGGMDYAKRSFGRDAKFTELTRTVPVCSQDEADQ